MVVVTSAGDAGILVGAVVIDGAESVSGTGTAFEAVGTTVDSFVVKAGVTALVSDYSGASFDS